MNNPYRGGTPDWWYSGALDDLWVEYKFLPRIPQRGVVTPALSELQKLWLRERYKEGRNVCVIVGCPAGGVVLNDLEWEFPQPVNAYLERLMDRKTLANWIRQKTMR